VNDVIDLTADEKHFYFNPYSGELSLEFPKAERSCRGGILACVLSDHLQQLYTDLSLSDGTSVPNQHLPVTNRTT
jgi:hypothetical protein